MRIALILMVAVLAAAPAVAWAADKPAAKPAAAPKSAASIPRTRDGRPDFGDVTWLMPYQAMIETFPGIQSELVVSEEQAKALFARMTAIVMTTPNFKIDSETAATYTESLGLPLVRGKRHTRLVVSPADGRLPMTPEARREMNRAFGGGAGGSGGGADNPEDRPAGERCLDNGAMAPNTFIIGAPRQFIQTRDHIVIHVEYGDEVRIVPFAKAHEPWAVHPQGGDSIARWDGDTLVIETVNFPAWNRMRSPIPLIVNPEAKVTERYTRLSATELLYQFTVEDPKVYAGPWMGEYSFYPTTGRMFPSGCHEGNYSLFNILGAAREAERIAKAKAP